MATLSLASISSISIFVNLIFSVLSAVLSSFFCTSTSHQFLCSSSSCCSAWRRKIIFCIMALILSYGPAKAMIEVASFSSAPLWAFLPTSRRRATALALASLIPLGTDAICRNEAAFVGISWLSGLRTPVTFLRISIALSMDLTSFSRITVLSSNSPFTVLHSWSVASMVVVSATKFSFAAVKSASALASSEALSDLMASFSLLLSFAAATAPSRAFFASSYWFCLAAKLSVVWILSSPSSPSKLLKVSITPPSCSWYTFTAPFFLKGFLAPGFKLICANSSGSCLVASFNPLVATNRLATLLASFSWLPFHFDALAASTWVATAAIASSSRLRAFDTSFSASAGGGDHFWLIKLCFLTLCFRPRNILA